MRESVFQTQPLHALVKHSGDGNLHVHNPIDLQFIERNYFSTFCRLMSNYCEGSGGCGIIYKVTINNRLVAMKLLQINGQKKIKRCYSDIGSSSNKFTRKEIFLKN
jgi:hypothetical protein